MSYSDYLDLDQLLAAQHLRSDPPHHDELLFIVQHQTTELWLKLMLHELRGVRAYLDADHVHHALKCLARVKHIQCTLTEQWSVLATLTPSEYAGVSRHARQRIGLSVSAIPRRRVHPGQQERADAQGVRLRSGCVRHAGGAAGAAVGLRRFLSFLARRGLEVPDDVLQRDVRRPWVLQPALIPVFQSIYDAVDRAFDLYERANPWSMSKTTSSSGDSSPADCAAHHRLQDWHRRLIWRALLAEGIGLDLLSRALCGANRDRQMSARFAVDDLWLGHRCGPTVLEDVAGRLRPVEFGLGPAGGLVYRGFRGPSCLASSTGMSILVWWLPPHWPDTAVVEVHDLGWIPQVARNWKINSPTGGLVKIAGPFLTAVGGYPTDRAWAPPGAVRELARPEDGVRAVEEAAQHGHDLIKLVLHSGAPLLDDATLVAVVRAAHRHQLPVGVHAEGEGQARRAFEADVDILVHVPWTESLPDDLIAAMAAP
jgi:tryptophan 2,3-dioxygenase